MRVLPRLCLVSAILVASASAAQAAPAPLSVTVEGIVDGKRVPDANALCLATPDGKSDRTGKNIRPAIGWSGAPAATKSYAIFVHDTDVPADFTDAGKEGKTLPVSAKRQDFFHYGVITIPAETTSFPGGAAHVKPSVGLQLPNDVGLNKYVASPEQFGGPCPPWNDERLHHYHFVVLALDKDAPITAAPATDCANANCRSDTAKATYQRLIASPHLLAQGEVVGTYSLNAKMK